MRIAKTRLISPDDNEAYATFAIALSFFVFAYSFRFGQASILAYYALWLPLVVIDYRRVLGNYTRYAWIFAFALFACLSVFWSQAPGVTARAGVQYLSHVVCALIAMRVVDTRTLVRGGLIGTGLVLLYSMAFGVYHLDPLDGTYSFVGAFASKNQLGFYASLAVLFAFAALFLGVERGLWKLAAVGGVLVALYCLKASQSATSVLTTVAIAGLCLALRALERLVPRHRKMLFVALCVLTVLIVIAGAYGGGYEMVLGAFGKDATLTGRTYLWQQGVETAGEAPLVGIGYQAFWVQGFALAEKLWADFFISTRGGFHFHNTFIAATVETGLIGCLLLTTVLIVTLGGHLGRLLSAARDEEALVLFTVAALLAVRTFVEIDILNPYHVGSFLLYFAAGKLADGRRSRFADTLPRRAAFA
ncbi:O-antigen ligase family protein [Shinella curvata]|uniref:O-antigen ligase family protein n=1 Tax=Shinella curvata TaxID=1817964 RepID=A0ABT8XBL3_9HYPH|nr:O-antigen ligase [Shinella curvata]MCJ8054776.1 O-antigen ligase family protein [Shinella curvata]MDO6120829.1 O-antigen ligase family protein [Shinella curvata]